MNTVRCLCDQISNPTCEAGDDDDGQHPAIVPTV